MKNLKLIFALFLFTQLNFAQERIVYGIVKDNLGTLSGANVQIEGKNRGTSTDFDGKYSIKANSNEFLIFSYLGKKKHIIIADKIEINVELESDGIILKESYEPNLLQIKNKKVNYGDILKIKGSPKYNFTYNSLNSNYIIYIKENKKNDSLDIEFEKKFNITYCPREHFKNRYYKKHNKLTFKYLDKKYKKNWQVVIRKDAIGFNTI
jgi:hypothetical protein